MKNKLLLTTGFTVLLTSGCASIVSDNSYSVQIDSTPTNANLTLVDSAGTELYSGTTPATITLKSGAGYFKPASYSATLEKEGFTPKTSKINGSIDGWYFGNFAIGGLLGFLIIDPISGAMWRLPTSNLTVLDALTPTAPETTSAEATPTELEAANSVETNPSESASETKASDTILTENSQ